MPQTLLAIAIGCTVFLGLCLLLSAALLRTSPEVDRLKEVLAGGNLEQDGAHSRRRLVERLGRMAREIRSRFDLGPNPKLRERLYAAGMRSAAAPDLFFAAQCLLPLVGAFAGSFIRETPLFWVFAFAVIGYIAPDFWLTEKTRLRRKRILRSMPDAVDLLVICVDAGLGLDQALIRVGEELAFSHPDIHEELARVHLEQRAGKPRLEAWEALVSRTRLPEFAAFVSMLTQTDRFGTPIVTALSRFADDLRVKRRQRVEEAAAKTKIKIIFPLVFCIFPSLFIVLLAPALMNIARELKGPGR